MKRALPGVALASLVLAGCGPQTTQLSYETCHYPDSPGAPAPTWICDQPVEGLELQAVGFARNMASGPGFMKDVAASEARAQLAQVFANDVKVKLERFTQDQLTNGESQSSDVAERAYSVLAAMNMSNSRILRTQSSPAGGIYVLVGLTKEHYDANVDELFNNQLDTETPGLYQQFLKEEGGKALDQTRQNLKKL